MVVAVAQPLQPQAARPVLAQLAVFGVRVAEALDDLEVVLPVAARYAKSLETHSEAVERLARFLVPALWNRLVPLAVFPGIHGAHGEPRRGDLVLHGDLHLVSAVRNRAQLAGEIEPDAGEVLKKRIDAKKRRTLMMRWLAVFPDVPEEIGIAVAPGDADCRRAVRRALDLRPERIALKDRNIESSRASEEDAHRSVGRARRARRGGVFNDRHGSANDAR